jgi:AMP deaminase
MSPLGEDILYIKYEENPFHDFFRRGLAVTLSTDNPTQLHTTDEPLVEEYSIAAKVEK